MERSFAKLDRCFSEPIEESSPDEAFDVVFMMTPEDWEELSAAWSERPASWREYCAYVLGQGPPKECARLLQAAIFDEETEVAAEAACSLASLRLTYPERVTLGEEELNRLREVVRLTGAKHMEIVLEVLPPE